MNNFPAKRGVPGYDIIDVSSLANLEYNNAAGAQKVIEVGRHLVPILSGGSYITDLSTATSLPAMGKSLAIYNNSDSLGSITLGEDGTITSLSPGQTDADGHVGIPIAPNAWTYVACGFKQWAITSSSDLITMLIQDSSSFKPQPNQPMPAYAPTNSVG